MEVDVLGNDMWVIVYIILPRSNLSPKMGSICLVAVEALLSGVYMCVCSSFLYTYSIL